MNLQDEKLRLKESQVADLQKLLKQRDPETKVSSYSEYVNLSLAENEFCSNVCIGYSSPFSQTKTGLLATDTPPSKQPAPFPRKVVMNVCMPKQGIYVVTLVYIMYVSVTFIMAYLVSFFYRGGNKQYFLH